MGSDDDHDWEAIAARDEKRGYQLPEEAPLHFGLRRVCPGRLAITYGGFSESHDVETGTVYVLLLVEGAVEEVVLWEKPLEGDGDRLVVGPEGSVVPVDVDSVSDVVVAWEYEGEVHVVYRGDL